MCCDTLFSYESLTARGLIIISIIVVPSLEIPTFFLPVPLIFRVIRISEGSTTPSFSSFYASLSHFPSNSRLVSLSNWTISFCGKYRWRHSWIPGSLCNLLVVELRTKHLLWYRYPGTPCKHLNRVSLTTYVFTNLDVFQLFYLAHWPCNGGF